MSSSGQIGRPALDTRVAFEQQGVTCLCRRSLEIELRRLYNEHRWVYDAMRAQAGAREVRGRRPVVAALLRPSVPVLVKRLHHGGLFAPFTGDRFASEARARTAVETADFLWGQGIPTPEVLFAAWRRVRGFVRSELGFRFFRGARDAAQAVFPSPGRLGQGWQETMRQVGALTARLHDVGVVHGDLNLMNFLLPEEGEVMILDLDKARVLGRLSSRSRHANLARLTRSVRKLGAGIGAEQLEQVLVTLEGSYVATAA